MEIAHWKFIVVIVAIIVMIVSYILSESKRVTAKQGKFFATLALVIFIALAAAGGFWFFSNKTR